MNDGGNIFDQTHRSNILQRANKNMKKKKNANRRRKGKGRKIDFCPLNSETVRVIMRKAGCVRLV